jgi:hypothetical protein
VLPDLQGQPVTTRELDWTAEFADHDQDAFQVARAWYALANCALPPPTQKPNASGTDNPDPLKYRIPKRPATIIFRQGPMRAQSYLAERLTKEGWFDAEPWAIDDLIDLDRAWLPKTTPGGQPTSARFGTQLTAQQAWREAAQRWQEHGTANGLRMDPARLQGYIAKAEEYARRHPGVQVGQNPPAISPEEAADPTLRDLHDAAAVVFNWLTNRQMTNFETFEVEASALQTDQAMLALKRFHEAQKAGPNYSEAVRLYGEGFEAWKQVMVSRQDCRARRAQDPGSPATDRCRDFRDLHKHQEDVYGLNLKYVKLAQDVRGQELRDATCWLNDMVFHAGAGTSGNPFQFALDLSVLAGESELPKAGPDDPVRTQTRVPQLKAVRPLPLPGPMDGLAPDGTPWITEDVKNQAREKLGLIKKPAPPPAAVGPDGVPLTPPAGGPGQ